ncbi:hypothetical protein [Eisenbergiella tayi]|uniref:hypothetical protein n=1 Tax=Eisenbergiella tayi TaxID=1432052 RepID=UPI000848A7AB|nr:hypothetical protein [Eisenbergiella tayi]ODR42370.1 hypothetical protein BEI60_02725 [Eisenbergiella tayi]
MRNYKVILKLTGPITQVPDSQKLFGALMYMFAEKYGDERAADLASAVRNKEIHLALSNIMPEGYLPAPKDYLMDHISKKNNLAEELKKKHAAIKIRSYIKSQELEHVLAEPESSEFLFPYVTQLDLQQLRASIDSVCYDIPELNTRLYSVPTVVLSEVSQDKKGREHYRPVDTYCYFLQVDDSSLCSDFLGMTEDAAVDQKMIILGKRASQGLNLFQFMEIAEQKGSGAEAAFYLNTGMLLPDSIDFKASSIKLFTSQRRPFEMTGGWRENAPKYYISFIEQGSIIVVREGVGHAGKSIESPFRQNRDIVFGNAFLYPIYLSERQV